MGSARATLAKLGETPLDSEAGVTRDGSWNVIEAHARSESVTVKVCVICCLDGRIIKKPSVDPKCQLSHTWLIGVFDAGLQTGYGLAAQPATPSSDRNAESKSTSNVLIEKFTGCSQLVLLSKCTLIWLRDSREPAAD